MELEFCQEGRYQRVIMFARKGFWDQPFRAYLTVNIKIKRKTINCLQISFDDP